MLSKTPYPNDPIRSLKTPASQEHGVWKKSRMVAAIWIMLFYLIQAAPNFPALFERSNAWWLWPLCWAGCVVLFALFGFRAHWRSGDAVEVPYWLAVLSVIAFLATFCQLTIQWTADRSLVWMAGFFGVAACGSFLFAVTAVTYGEVWRRRLNRSVVEHVWAIAHQAVKSSAAGRTKQRGRSSTAASNSNPSISQIGRDDWGSQHCLRILYAAFRLHLAKLAFPTDEAYLEKTRRLCHSGNLLLDYLLHSRWSKEQLSPRDQRSLIQQTLCELIIATLVSYARQLQRSEGPSELLASALPGLIKEWISHLESLSGSPLPPPSDPEASDRQPGSDAETWTVFTGTVRLLLDIGRDYSNHVSASTANPVKGKRKRRSLPLGRQSTHTASFQHLIRQAQTSGQVQPAIAGVPCLVCCCRLWLVAAPAIDEHLRLDSWLELFEAGVVCDEFGPDGEAARTLSDNQCLDFDIQDPSSWNLLTCRTVAVLNHVYKSWIRKSPREWDQSLKRAGHRFAEWNQLLRAIHRDAFRGDREGAIPLVPSSLCQRTETIPSWPYRQVWKTKAVRRFLRRRFCALFVPCTVVACLVHPALNPFKWNTVDHVGDNRWNADYTKTKATVAEIGADAAVIGSEKGSTVIRLKSRGIHEGVTNIAVVDLARAAETDTFLALERKQGVSRIMADRPEVRAEDWIPAPESPVWLGPKLTETPEVSAAAWDETGVVVALKGIGIGRASHRWGKEGQVVRSRSWSKVNIPNLRNAIITSRSVWTVADVYPIDGNTKTQVRVQIRQFDRWTFEEIGEHGFQRDIEHFDIDPLTDAACVRESDGFLWVKSPDRKEWHNVYAPSDKERLLKSANAVTIARWVPPLALLGTNDGLFVSDRLNRRMEPLLKNQPVTDIFVLGSSPDKDQAGTVDSESIPNNPAQPAEQLAAGPAEERRFLVVAKGGLYRIKWTLAEGIEKPERLEPDEVVAVDITPDGTMCVYQVASKPAPGDIRWLDPRQDHPTPQTIHKGGSWDRPRFDQSAPEIQAIKRSGNLVRVAMQQGMFEVNLDSHAYTDISNALYQDPDNQQKNGFQGALKNDRVFQFSALYSEGDDVAVIGDGCPLIWDKARRSWIFLDHRKRESLEQVVVCRQDGQRWLFARNKEGDLLRYNANLPFIQKGDGYCDSDLRTPFSASRPGWQAANPPGDTLLGDILALEGQPGFRAAFVRNDRMYHYDAATAHLSEMPLSQLGLGSTEELRLLRLMKYGPVGVTQDRRLMSDPRQALHEGFGFGEFPFPPEEATAINETGSNTSLLVAGPGGRVVDYNWRTGSVDPLGQLPQAEDVITRIHAAERVKLVLTRSGKVYSGLWPDLWEELSDWKDWTAHHSEIWALGERGVSFQQVKAESTLPGNLVPNYSRANGFQEFCSKAVYAWQPEPTTWMIFRADGQYGIYDVVSDNWREIPFHKFGALPEVREFLKSSKQNWLFAVCKDGIRQVHPNGESSVIIQLPPDAKSVSVQIVNDHLQYAVLEENKVALKSLPLERLAVAPERKDWTWESNAEWSRARSVAPFEFSPEEVVEAITMPSKTAVMLVDQHGSVAVYDFLSGQWSSQHRSQPEDDLEGWLIWPNGDRRLLVRGQDGTCQAVNIVKGHVQPNVAAVATLTESYPDEVRKAEALTRTAAMLHEAAQELPWLKSALGPAELELQRLSQERPVLRQAPPETLLKTEDLDITRHPAGTRYRFRLGPNRWETFSFQEPRFDLDDVTSLHLTPSGTLLATVNGQVRPLETSQGRHVIPGDVIPSSLGGIRRLETSVTGRLQAELDGGRLVHLDGEAIRSLRLQPEVPALDVGQLAFGAWELKCWVTAEGVSFDWIKPRGSIEAEPALWSASGEGFASQNVRDLELDGQGNLLVSTESALVIRDAKTYQIKAFYPEHANADLSRVWRPNQLPEVAIQGGQKSAVWRAGNLRTSASLGSTAIVESALGPWLWRVETDRDQSQATIRHRVDQRPRESMAAPLSAAGENRWRFRDDIVNWAIRDHADPDRLWIATEAGLWSWEKNQGRTSNRPEQLSNEAIQQIRQYADGSRAWQASSGEWHFLGNAKSPTAFESTCGHGAFTISSLDGRLSLESFDRQDVFVEDGFFFDRIDDMAAMEHRLYTRTQSRGLFARDPKFPGLVVKAWPDAIPNALEAQIEKLKLQAEQGLIVLADPLAVSSDPVRWKLDPKSPKAVWERELGQPWLPQAQIGPIAFLPDETSPHRYVPVRVADLGSPPPVPGQAGQPSIREELKNWWIGGRFSWDVIHNVAVLPDRSIIAASQAGFARLQTKDQTRDLLSDIEPVEKSDIEPIEKKLKLLPARTDKGRIGMLVRIGAADRLLRIEPEGDIVLEPQEPGHALERSPIMVVERAGRNNAAWGFPIQFREEWVSPQKSKPALQSRLDDMLPQDQLILNGQWAFDQGMAAALWNSTDAATFRSQETWVTVSELGNGESLLVENTLDLRSPSEQPRFQMRNVLKTDKTMSHLRRRSADQICGLVGDRPQLGQLRETDALWQPPDDELLKLFQTGDRLELRTQPIRFSHQPESVIDRRLKHPAMVTPTGVELFTATNTLKRSGILFSFDSYTRLAVDPDTNQIYIQSMAGLLTGEIHAQGEETLSTLCLSPGSAVIPPDSPLRLRLDEQSQPVLHDPRQQAMRFPFSHVKNSKGVPLSLDAFWFGRRPLVDIAALRRSQGAGLSAVSLTEGLFLLRQK